MSYYLYSLVGAAKQMQINCTYRGEENYPKGKDAIIDSFAGYDEKGYYALHGEHLPYVERMPVSGRIRKLVVFSELFLILGLLAINSLSIAGQIDSSIAQWSSLGMVAAGAVLAIGLANRLGSHRWKVLLTSLALVGGYLALNCFAGLGSPTTEWINMAPILTPVGLLVLALAYEIFSNWKNGVRPLC